MEFADIRLSFLERLALVRSRRKPIHAASYPRLLRHELITEVYSRGVYDPGPGLARISERGEDYLAFHRSESWKDYIIPIVVSAGTTLTTHSLLWLLQSIQ